jgi:NTP pyrophosphatase (non-canonical NTP hydrolase)
MADGPDRLDTLRSRLRDFVKERDWEQFHDPKNLAMCLGSEVGELLAEYRWVSSTKSAHPPTDTAQKKRIAEELGDVGIAWLLLCDRLGLEPLEVIESKLELNRLKYPVESSRGQAERPT